MSETTDWHFCHSCKYYDKASSDGWLCVRRALDFTKDMARDMGGKEIPITETDGSFNAVASEEIFSEWEQALMEDVKRCIGQVSAGGQPLLPDYGD